VIAAFPLTLKLAALLAVGVKTSDKFCDTVVGTDAILIWVDTEPDKNWIVPSGFKAVACDAVTVTEPAEIIFNVEPFVIVATDALLVVNVIGDGEFEVTDNCRVEPTVRLDWAIVKEVKVGIGYNPGPNDITPLPDKAQLPYIPKKLPFP
jgi:hypothetical protein